MPNPISAIKNAFRPSATRTDAVDPKDPEAHAKFLAKRTEKGETGPIYVRETLLGQKYLSFTAPRQKKASAKAYLDLLIQTGANQLVLKSTLAGELGRELYVRGDALLKLGQYDTPASTKDLEQLVMDLALVKNQAKKTDREPRQTTHLEQSISPNVLQLQDGPVRTDGTPTPKRLEATTDTKGTKYALPEFPSPKELDDFQLGLRQARIERPSYPDVSQYVAHLNSTIGTVANRELSGRERNEADDLLTYIAKDITGMYKWEDGIGLTGRPVNKFGERSFETRLEAARFLFTETDFLKNLNPQDSAYYMGIYGRLIEDAQQTRQEQLSAS